METLWKTVKVDLKNRVPDHSYWMWIEPLLFKSWEGQKLVLTCPNFFSQKRVRDHYGPLIESEIKKATGKPCNLLIEIAENPGRGAQDPTTGTKIAANCSPLHLQKPPERQLDLPNLVLPSQTGRMLRRDLTFDKFVIGSCNKFAYSAALSLASEKNSNQNALFLLSKTGLGKTHLSQAIGHHILTRYPEEAVYYMTAEDFTNEMIAAIRSRSIEGFKQKYRNNCDVLLLEDVHFLTGKEKTQIELAMTLDCLFEANKKVIFSSCHLPTEIPKLSAALKSRLSCGLISGIEAPDFNTRMKILKTKAREKRLDIPANVIDYLAGELTRNVRQLESGLYGVTAKSSLLGIPIDLDLAQSIIENITGSNQPITIETIKRLVCDQYDISMDEIVSKSRRQAVVLPRQVAMYLSRKYTDQPFKAIANCYNRYHATAIHAINTVERAVKTKGALYKQVEILSRKLENGEY